MTLLRWLVGLAALVVGGGAWGFYVAGNGFVPGTLALAGLPVALILVAIGTRRAGLAAATVALGELTFAGVRWHALDSGGPFAFCTDGDCSARPPLLAGLIREDESAWAGIALTSALGLILPTERAAVGPAAHARYAHLDALRGGRPGVNALLLGSTAARVREIVSMPPGDGPVPGLVFLHGYGGSLTAYVSTLRTCARLDGYAIVAPALSFEGDWWNPDGLAVVGRTLDTLPARIDRSRVSLVGLSNGAVGAAAVAAEPALAARLRTVIALEGIAAPKWFGVPTALAVVAAEDDARFRLGYVEAEVDELRQGGADVSLTVVPGDHLALFTHPREVTEALADQLDR